MGIVPLQYEEGQTAESLGLTGKEEFDIDLPEDLRPKQLVEVRVSGAANAAKTFRAVARFDTELELAYYKNGGILNFMIRKMIT